VKHSRTGCAFFLQTTVTGSFSSQNAVIDFGMALAFPFLHPEVEQQLCFSPIFMRVSTHLHKICLISFPGRFALECAASISRKESKRHEIDTYSREVGLLFDDDFRLSARGSADGKHQDCLDHPDGEP
jgi:hypothetical protein